MQPGTIRSKPMSHWHAPILALLELRDRHEKLHAADRPTAKDLQLSKLRSKVKQGCGQSGVARLKVREGSTYVVVAHVAL